MWAEVTESTDPAVPRHRAGRGSSCDGRAWSRRWRTLWSSPLALSKCRRCGWPTDWWTCTSSRIRPRLWSNWKTDTLYDWLMWGVLISFEQTCSMTNVFLSTSFSPSITYPHLLQPCVNSLVLILQILSWLELTTLSSQWINVLLRRYRPLFHSGFPARPDQQLPCFWCSLLPSKKAVNLKSQS